MNYLAHLLVLPDQGLVTLGNLLGDFFKGRLDTIEPIDLRTGVALHRQIDRFSDTHPVFLRSKARISPERRRVAGALIDIFYDHFLAPTVELGPILYELEPYFRLLPPTYQHLPPRLISYNWLGAYEHIEMIAEVLVRMQQRRTRITGLIGAEQELRQHYDALAEDFREFYPQLQAFTKDAFLRLQSASPAAAPSDAAAAIASDPPGSA